MSKKKITNKVQKAKEDFSNKPLRELFQFSLGVKMDGKREHGKTISVDDLTVCQHKRNLFEIVNKPKEAKIVVLAVKHNQSETWTAYAGYPDVRDIKPIEFIDPLVTPNYDWMWLCENVRDSEQIKIMGEVLPRYVAEQLFPDWDISMYQWGETDASPALLAKASKPRQKRNRMNE